MLETEKGLRTESVDVAMIWIAWEMTHAMLERLQQGTNDIEIRHKLAENLKAVYAAWNEAKES